MAYGEASEMEHPGPEGGDDDLNAKLGEWERAMDRHWAEWRREARECFDLWAGRSWETADRQAMEAAKRIPVEFNRVAPLIKAVVGAEIANRLRVDYKPRTQGDVSVNELLTSGAEWVRDNCDAESEETDAFMNATICGLGWTESRFDLDEMGDDEIVKDVVDSLEMDFDPSARKRNAIDRKYQRRRRQFTRREARERFGDEAFGHDGAWDRDVSVDDPATAYSGEDGKIERGDMVTVSEIQWWEHRVEYEVFNDATGDRAKVDEAQFSQLQEAAASAGRQVRSVKRKTRVYHRAFKTADRILYTEELPIRRFTYNCITGDYDRNKGVWSGLVRPMRDPQKWANKFFSEILHILRTNSKGGVMAEEGAIKDQRQFEETWSSGDAITKVGNGALTQNRIQEKPVAQYPQGMDRLMDFSLTSIRETAGISPEFMGQADREQAGVLEHQRKQAAYGILGSFFDSLRRYRVYDGRLLLDMMRFLPPETLVRVARDDWDNPKFVQLAELALDDDTVRYDVICDEAPSGPNQKERTWSALMQVLPAVKDMMSPELWVLVLEYAPLPEPLVASIKALVSNGEADPMAEIQKAMTLEGMAADVDNKVAQAAKTGAEAEKANVETVMALQRPDPNPQVSV